MAGHSSPTATWDSFCMLSAHSLKRQVMRERYSGIPDVDLASLISCSLVSASLLCCDHNCEGKKSVPDYDSPPLSSHCRCFSSCLL